MGDLRLRIWKQAKIMNMVTVNQVNYAAFKSILDDTTEHLLEGYKLSKDQQPGRVEFHNFQFDLEEHIRTNMALLGFQSIFGNAVREKALRAVCKQKASVAHNQLQSLFNSRNNYKHGTIPGDINDEDEDEDDDESVNPHSVKRSRTAPADKIKKGVDFWSTIDRLLAVIITE
ncbi:hypothetical protein F5I97DRAFT_1931525 [Phlebopus sp. FC_14]|nr:hypothetical protein F5I97DRAFT_1931525 [Phlebopus sp. FC_14]